MKDGIPGSQLKNLISQYFNFSPLSSSDGVSSAIDNGNAIMAAYQTKDTDANKNPIYHAVTIVGYSDNQYLVADSAANKGLGGYDEIPKDWVDYDYVYEIKGFN